MTALEMLYPKQLLLPGAAGARRLLETTVADFNETVARLGSAISVSFWADGGSEWEFECRGSPEVRDTLIAKLSRLDAAMRACPEGSVRLDRDSKRLFVT